jgi:hypothetical protein
LGGAHQTLEYTLFGALRITKHIVLVPGIVESRKSREIAQYNCRGGVDGIRNII